MTDNENNGKMTRKKSKGKNYHLLHTGKPRQQKDEKNKVQGKKEEGLRDKIQLLEQTIKTMRTNVKTEKKVQ